MYVERAEKEDKELADRWQKDADGILIFTGLFSAAVAVFAAVSIQDLRPNPQDTSAFYLSNIYQLLADPNISRASILATPAQPPPFSPPTYAIWVNSLWFLSLAISLTGALLATLLQQWARRYIAVTHLPRYSPHKRARVRAFFVNGVERLHLPRAVETLPTLLHLSLFLFFSGLLIFLFNINHTAFSLVAWWIGLSGGVYGCITLMPIFCHDSPYYAPLSSTAWFLYNGISYGVFRILKPLLFYFNLKFSSAVHHHFWRLYTTYRHRTLWGIVKTAQETAWKPSGKIDGNILKWIFDSLDEDRELETFCEGIPGFCSSKVVNEPREVFGKLDTMSLNAVFRGFLGRTCSSSLLSEGDKERRIGLCMQAVDALDLQFPCLGVFSTYLDEQDMGEVFRFVEMGHSLRSRCRNSDDRTSFPAQSMVAGIVASVPERDDRWKALVKAHLGISDGVLQDYLAHGDSVLLANLIYFIRQLFRYYDKNLGSYIPFPDRIVKMISKFEIRNTLPGLKHDFCALWNSITREAHENQSLIISDRILRPIRHHYIALHQGTDSAPTAFDADTVDYEVLRQPSSYPLCHVPGHHSHGPTGHPTITSPSSHHLDPILSGSSRTASDVSSSTTDHSPIHLEEHSSLCDGHSRPVSVGNDYFATTSPDLATTEAHTDTPIFSPMANPKSDS
ncbi:hypothetical protein BGW80DRAFT_528818 [Lactifluus volemus]|nr:hypothetical protein BGW80DRAFT_528818 [Lactifluus volemus]